MVDIQTISIVIAATGVTLAAAYYVLHLRHQTKMRQTELVISLYRDFGSGELQGAWQKVMTSEYKDYSNYVTKYGLNEVYRVAMFFEGIGTLLHMKLVDLFLIEHLISGPIQDTWDKMKPLIRDHRQRIHSPQFCEWFEYLYNEIKKREQKLQRSKV